MNILFPRSFMSVAYYRVIIGLMAILYSLSVFSGHGPRHSDIASTKHNLSANADSTHPVTGGRALSANSETEICVFCHTPHGAENLTNAPLWNRKINETTDAYTPYTSASLDAGPLNQPEGTSKLCLSCHDGTLAIGAISNAPGSGMGNGVLVGGETGPSPTTPIPSGPGQLTGFTRDLGVDLRNDHPISVTYTQTLAELDGELRIPDGTSGNGEVTSSNPDTNNDGAVIAKRHVASTGTSISAAMNSGGYAFFPLEEQAGVAQVQCATCHDPHLSEDLAAGSETWDVSGKFLRENRFQISGPSLTNDDFVKDQSIVCLGCHVKDGWAESAHAQQSSADEAYHNDAAQTRQFPAGIRVWEAACLNCHDAHTVSGSRRLLREGVETGTIGSGRGILKIGSSDYNNSAIEETCYQCHQLYTSTSNRLNLSSQSVPNIKSQFEDTYHMPIKTSDQGDYNGSTLSQPGKEVHDIGTGSSVLQGGQRGANFIEGVELLGDNNGGTLVNRHVECTDCHNPHRVAKESCFNGKSGTDCSGASNFTPDTAGTHNHGDGHTNIASGVLRGAWGVEPVYTDNSFHVQPSDFKVKRGMPSDAVANPPDGGDTCSTDTDLGCKWVTREYHICMKCHSNYAYSAPPLLRNTTNRKGLTASGTNGLTQYTNQGREFQAPTTHSGDSDGKNLGTEAGANSSFNTNNHRGWHPVMRNTDRNASARGLTASSAFNAPWDAGVGTQTMYCSDCHGANTGSTVVPSTGEAWGPHGSSNPFILKGPWDQESENNDGATGNLCRKCHNPTSSSGFSGGGKGNLHAYHETKVDSDNNEGSVLECTWCHIAVPHGWKNRSLLVNLNDVGPEAEPVLCPNGGCEVRMGTNNSRTSVDYYTKPPYYLQAKLKIRSFGTPGSWDQSNCGSANRATTIPPTNNSSKTTNSTSIGLDWMKQTDGGVCFNPP